MQFHIKAPLFVARQLAKHQVGLSWNEVSRRYVDHKPEFYTPTGWRGRAKTNKQGSSGYIQDQGTASLILEDVHNKCLDEYEMLLKLGVAPEQARMVLPQTMLTEWYWSGSLYAFARVYKERSSRLGGDSQRETQAVADQIERWAEYHFPHSWFALTCPDSDQKISTSSPSHLGGLFFRVIAPVLWRQRLRRLHWQKRKRS